MLIVTLENKGVKFFLRGTTWAFSEDRANRFETIEAAQAALDRARKFMLASIHKRAMIVRAS